MPYARDYKALGVKHYKLSPFVVDVAHTLVQLPDGELMTTCWCERQYVRVRKEELFAGYTNSCGHKECVEHA